METGREQPVHAYLKQRAAVEAGGQQAVPARGAGDARQRRRQRRRGRKGRGNCGGASDEAIVGEAAADILGLTCNGQIRFVGEATLQVDDEVTDWIPSCPSEVRHAVPSWFRTAVGVAEEAMSARCSDSSPPENWGVVVVTNEMMREYETLLEANNTSPEEYALMLTNTAISLSQQAQYPEALEAYLVARTAHEVAESTDTEAYGKTLQYLGDYLATLNLDEEAMEAFVEARATYEASGHQYSLDYAVVLHNLGVCFSRLDKEESAAQYFNCARKLYELLGRTDSNYTLLMESLRALEGNGRRPLRYALSRQRGGN
eukprot:TRINITY_DN22713_c0_g1_i7.p1 TRINITY_DN22713_c0_g1~~TRINITY_DN22713_c0_g1_i7.p1  ORF type:complete len:355 (-),score=51.93 TRINITY_DN22713_c0_g1_i7:561-1508(-)